MQVLEAASALGPFCDPASDVASYYSTRERHVDLKKVEHSFNSARNFHVKYES